MPSVPFVAMFPSHNRCSYEFGKSFSPPQAVIHCLVSQLFASLVIYGPNRSVNMFPSFEQSYATALLLTGWAVFVCHELSPSP